MMKRLIYFCVLSGALAVSSTVSQSAPREKAVERSSSAKKAGEVVRPQPVAPVQTVAPISAGSDVRLVPMIGHTSAIKAMAFSPDGRRVLTGANDRTAKVWDTATGRLLLTLQAGQQIDKVAFSADGAVVHAGSSRKLFSWNLATGALMRTIDLQGSLLDLSADAARLLLSTSTCVCLLDTASGKTLQSFVDAITGSDTAVLSRDGRMVATTGNAITLRDSATGQLLSRLEDTAEAKIVAISPDGSRIATAGSDNAVRLWNGKNGSLLTTLKSDYAGPRGGGILATLAETGNIASLAFSPDGSQLLSGGPGSLVNLWNTRDGSLLRTLEQEGTSGPIAFSPDGKRMVSAGDASAHLWDTATGTPMASFKGRAQPSGSVATAPGSNLVATSAEGSVNIWDGRSGELVRRLQAEIGARVAFAPDGAHLFVSTDTNPVIQMIDVRSGLIDKTYEIPASGSVSGLAVSPDGARLLVVARFGKIFAALLFDVRAGTLLRRFPDTDQTLQRVIFSPDGKRALAMPDLGDGALLLDLTTGVAVRRFDNLRAWRGAAAFASRGSTIMATDGIAVTAWDPVTGAGVGKFRIETLDKRSGNNLTDLSNAKYASSAQFSADTSLLLTGNDAGRLMLWNEGGQMLRTFDPGHLAEVTSIAFGPREGLAVSSADDATTRFWNIQTGALLATCMTSKDGEWLCMTPEGFFSASTNGAQMLTVVQGLEVYAIDQFYQTLYRPDLVREKLAGDPQGRVRTAAASLDLTKVLASGAAPTVAVMSPARESTATTDQVTVEAAIADRGGGVGKVEWRINGVTSAVESRGLERIAAPAGPPGKTSTVRRTMALAPGDNRIEIVAYNAEGLIASEPARVTVKWDSARAATPPKLFVLAVGVNDYYDSRLRLSYAVPDASAIAEGFRKAGNGLYAAVDVTTVLDTDVTVANLDRVFTELGSKAQPSDVFVFFLAGHGKTKNGKYYFLPRDFRYEDETSIEKAGMDQEKFQAWFAKIPARKSILLYDTCESGSLTGAAARGGDIDERLGALNRMTRATGRTFLTATTDDAPALEGYRGHGVFTYAILDALDHADVNNNGLIEVSELADYIDQKVPDISFEAFKLRQIPQRSIVGNNFALTNKTEILAKAGNPPVLSPVATTKPTHVVISPADVFEQLAGQGAKLEQLPAGTMLSLVKTERGWGLVARDGKSLGYVAEDHLARIQ